VHGRIIDLSLAAARDIDMVRAGTARVRLKVIRAPATEQRAQSSTPEIARVYAVQVGAFTDRSRAEALSESLGFSQARVEEPDGASPLWRVLVGHDLTKDAAEALASELRSSAGSGMVVQEKYTSEE
jgi:cell division septation protein DedD